MAEDLRKRIIQAIYLLTAPHSFHDAVPAEDIIKALAGEYQEPQIRDELMKLYKTRYVTVRSVMPVWRYQVSLGVCGGCCEGFFNAAGLRLHEQTCPDYRDLLDALRNPDLDRKPAPRPAVEQAIEQTEAAVPVAPIVPRVSSPAVSRHLLPVETIVLEIAREHERGTDREKLIQAAHARKPSVSVAIVRTEVARLIKRRALIVGEDGLLTFSPHWCTCGRDYRDFLTLKRHRSTCASWNRVGGVQPLPAHSDILPHEED